MIGKVVVGFDGSAGAAIALRWGVTEARLHNVNLVTFVALEAVPPASSPLAPVSDDSETLLDSLRVAAHETAGDAVTEFRYGVGGAAQQLADACQDDDVLVVGSRGRNPFAGLLLGSVSRTCLTVASCPVVVVREEPEPLRQSKPVVVGVDASDPSRRALRVAAQEARVRGVDLHAIHAVHWDYIRAELIAPTTRQLVSWGTDLVASELDHSAVAARPVVLNGHPSDVLVRHSEYAELLVLGSRGHNQVAGMLLGSTSDYCARHAQCPVMVVH